MSDTPYQHVDDTLVQSFTLSEKHILDLVARDIRKERTGVHASIDAVCRVVVRSDSPQVVRQDSPQVVRQDSPQVVQPGSPQVPQTEGKTLLGWNTFNVGRDADRRTLALSVLKHLPEDLQSIPLKHWLDTFCIGLWDEELKRFAPEDMTGAHHLEPPTYLLYPYLTHGGGTILFGPPGRGKSWTLLLMAQSVHRGIDKLWKPGFAPNVLFINLERSVWSVSQRLARVNLFLGLPQNASLWCINARGRSLADVEGAARKFVHAHDVELVIVDSLSRAGFGSLKEDEDVNAAMDCLNALAPSWLAAGHSPKADDSTVFGSQMFPAAADTLVQLASEAPDSSTLGIKLKITKVNDGGKLGYTETLAYEFDDSGFSTARPARDHEFPNLSFSSKPSLTDSIKFLIDEKGPLSASAIAKALHQDISNISKFLRANPDFSALPPGKNNERKYTLS